MPTEVTINLPAHLTPQAVPDPPEIYIKTDWEKAWVAADPYLRVDIMKWSVAPSIPMAQFSRNYGKAIRPGIDSDYQTVFRITDLESKFVRILWEDREWVGVFVSSADYRGGVSTLSDGVLETATGVELEWAVGGPIELADSSVDIGMQQFIAYGLEYLLKRTPMTKCWYFPSTPPAAGNGADIDSEQSEGGLAFNENGLRNRSKYVYAVPAELGGNGDTHIFQSTQDFYQINLEFLPEYWSTRDIVGYMSRYHVPRDGYGDEAFIVDLDVDDYEKLQSGDSPEVETEGQTVGSLYDQLIPRSRLLTWYLRYYEFGLDPHETAMALDIRTYTERDIELPDGGTIPANERLLTLNTRSSGAQASYVHPVIQTNGQDVYHEVIVRGDKRVVIGTIPGSSVRVGWTIDEHEDYNSGGNSSPVGDIADQREDASDYRSIEAMSPVFRNFKIDGAYLNQISEHSAFTRSLLPTLPNVKAGVDYSGTSVDSDATLGLEDIQPFYVLARPGESGKYVMADRLSYGADVPTVKDEDDKFKEFTVSVRTLRSGLDFKLEVSGQQQHIIAMGSSSGTINGTRAQFIGILPRDKFPGQWAWEQGMLTVAWVDDRYCEARVPDEGDISKDIHAVSTLVIDAGDEYQTIEMLADTVFDVSATGGLRKSTTALMLRDDSEKLKTIAAIAYYWYSKPRIAVEMEMGYDSALSELQIGDFLEKIDDTDVNSIVTEISLTFSHDRTEGPSPTQRRPMLEFKTGYHELDVMKL